MIIKRLAKNEDLKQIMVNPANNWDAMRAAYDNAWRQAHTEAVSSILDNVGFVIDTSGAVESKPPTADELRILREDIDPDRLILE